MYHNTKIATCCYCGTRAALVLKGRDRHELACSGCGAPLHNLKALKVPERDAPRRKVAYHGMPKPSDHKKKPKKSKQKSRVRHLFGEAFDLLEDIFD